jgi:hypothetical protein
MQFSTQTIIAATGLFAAQATAYLVTPQTPSIPNSTGPSSCEMAYGARDLISNNTAQQTSACSTTTSMCKMTDSAGRTMADYGVCPTTTVDPSTIITVTPTPTTTTDIHGKDEAALPSVVSRIIADGGDV